MGDSDKRFDKQQVRSFVERTRAQSDDLVAAGVDRARLEDKLSKIENCADESHEKPSRLRSLLTELQADLIEFENKLIATGLLQELHQILGTGVPAPR